MPTSANIQELTKKAHAAYLSGEKGEAERLARAALDTLEFPPSPQAIMIVGTVMLDTGRLIEAKEWFEQAVAMQPKSGAFLKGLAETFARSGDDEASLLALEGAIALDPRDWQALHYRGDLLQRLGRPALAVEAYQKSLSITPAGVPSWNNLGTALLSLGQIDQACEAYHQAVKLAPEFMPALRNAGLAELARGRPELGEPLLRRALARAPESCALLIDHGNLLRAVGRIDEAVGCYEAVLAIEADNAVAHYNLGVVLHNRGEPRAAIPHYQHAVKVDPDSFQAWDSLGHAQRWAGELSAALDSHRQALALKPGWAPALEKLVEVEQALCAWDELDQHIDQLLTAFRTDPSFVLLPLLATQLPTSREEQLEAASRAWRAAPGVAGTQPMVHAVRRKIRPLRVAYLGSDFNLHATSHLIAELFELHDREKIAAFAFSTGPADASKIRHRIKNAASGFSEVHHASAESIATQIIDQDIDILVDLNGHTAGARLDVLARKPAPIQASWLGFPGTTGTNLVDYLIADEFVAPPEHAGAYAEKLVYLPHCYQINDRQRVRPGAPSRAGAGLPEHVLVLACFNQLKKITPSLFALWMRLLESIPDSVLWLLAGEKPAQENLRRAACVHGIDAGRLVFAPPVPVAAHLARVQLADLFLDTLPYNAHTTASDALWMGVPLVTSPGSTFASRVAGSLLKAVGLNELAVGSLKEYEGMVLSLASDRGALSKLKNRLGELRNSCPLFDTPHFVQALERGYALMWERYTTGLAPALIRIEGSL